MPIRSDRPVLVDLYAGAGGLSLGMEQAGFHVAAAVEIDPVHALTHRFNFPATPVICGDIARVSAGQIRDVATAGWQRAYPSEPFPGITAVVGGPPCQGFSAGGVRNEDDARNNQFLRFVDLVVELRPEVLCLENVAGLLEARFAPLRDRAFGRLEAAGYALSGTDKLVNAADFGVPQKRKRLIVLGGLRGAPKLPAATHAITQVSVGEALEGMPVVENYRELVRSDEVALSPSDIARRAATTSSYARMLAGLESSEDDLSPRRIWSGLDITCSLRTVHNPVTLQRFADTAPGTVEGVSRLYRLSEAGLSRTLRAGTGPDRGSHTSPRPIHPVSNRVVTVREAARLHGYPDWFRFHATNWHGHRQIGNSVPPPLAAAAGRGLVDFLGVFPGRPDAEKTVGEAQWLRLSVAGAASVVADLPP